MPCASAPRRTTRPAARRASCWPSPCSEHVAAATADLTEQIEVAEARAAVIWQGEQIPYRQVPNRAADIANRTARNALYDGYLGGGGGDQSPARGEAGSGSHGGARPRLRRCPRHGGGDRRLRPRCAGGRDAPLPGRVGDGLLRRPAPVPGRDRHRAGRRLEGRSRARDPRRGMGSLVRGAPHAAGLPRHAQRAGHRHRRPAEHPAGHPAAAAEDGARVLRGGQRAERRAAGHAAARRLGRLRRRCSTKAATPSTSRTSTRLCRCRGDCSATTA